MIVDDHGEANRATLKPPMVLPGGVLLEDVLADTEEEGEG